MPTTSRTDSIKIDLARALLKDAHNHGQPFALFNLVVGLLLPHLALGGRGKTWLSYLAAISFMLPVGLLSRGIAGGSMVFAPITFAGGIAFVAAACLIAVGAWRMSAGKTTWRPDSTPPGRRRRRAGR